MASCQYCNNGGANMLQCQSCRAVWCDRCITHFPENVPHYPPKPSASNQCPFCGQLTSMCEAP